MKSKFRETIGRISCEPPATDDAQKAAELAVQVLDKIDPHRKERHAANQQEWGRETVRQFWRENQKLELMDDEQWDTFFQSVANAHNAAIKAERKRYLDTEANGVVFCGKCGHKL